ncbi:MAG: phosphotransferase enzyme family protein [Bacteriovorax sp.]
MKPRFVNLLEAKKAVILWHGNPDSVVHLGNSANSIFKFIANDNGVQIIRFIDNYQRNHDQVQGEVEFLEHLKSKNAPSCYAIPSCNGLLTEQFESESGMMTCTSLNFIDGIEIKDTNENWGKDFFEEWGRSLAYLHRASRSYRPTKKKRWDWDQEHLIINAETLIPKNDQKSLQIFRDLVFECRRFEKTIENFGMIHADLAPQNFQFNPKTMKIKAIDFDNCCYHWYLSDLAISLSTVRRKNNRETIRSGILEGYSQVETLPNNYEERLDILIRLRIIYVYLDRLHRFGLHPNPVEEKNLQYLRERVHAQEGW